ncbi:MAG: acyltransferase [Pseudohongiella sp.]|uniref:acyltransferase n=1 Tax=Pseudohongiella sp. TaxID=1979412 RepID=UPI00349FEC56
MKLLSSLRVVTATILLSLNSIIHVTPLLLVALIKAIIRVGPVLTLCDRVLMAIVASWIDVNSWMFDHLTNTEVVVTGLPDPMPEGHFLLICNHQSWVDIPVLQKLFNRRLPMLRFFLKSQLIWVPVLGLAWWALDFPFMKRYSRQQIEKRPDLAGRDAAATRKACEKFRRIPVSIVNFAEGTRFRTDKHANQQSPFRHLLKPRAGGTALVLDAMAESLDTLVDVTITYPEGAGELNDLFANRIGRIVVDVQTLPIPAELRGGDYQNDEAHRARMQAWVNERWQIKDKTIDRLLKP